MSSLPAWGLGASPVLVLLSSGVVAILFGGDWELFVENSRTARFFSRLVGTATVFSMTSSGAEPRIPSMW